MSLQSRIRSLLPGLWLLCTAVPALAAPTLVFWNSQQASDAVSAIAADFTRSSGIKVETNWIIQADYRSSLLRHAADGDLPDVALVAADLLSLDKELQYSVIDRHVKNSEILPNAVAGGIYEGRQLGVPVFWGNHLLLYYNRSLVTKPARTFAEMEAQIPGFKAQQVKPLGMNFGEMYWMVPFLGGFGGWPLDGSGKVTLDSRAMSQTLDFYFSLPAKGITLKECRMDCALDRFLEGEFAYVINGDWAYRDLRAKLGDKLGVTTLPAIDAKRPLVPMFSAYVLVFPKNSLNGPKREALLRFMRYMQSPEVQRRWFKETTLLPVNAQVYQEVTRKADNDLKASLNQLRQARAMPNDRGMAFAWDGIAKGFSAMYNGRANSAQAATLMQKSAEIASRRSGD